LHILGVSWEFIVDQLDHGRGRLEILKKWLFAVERGNIDEGESKLGALGTLMWCCKKIQTMYALAQLLVICVNAGFDVRLDVSAPSMDEMLL